jgi:hypothetical protein
MEFLTGILQAEWMQPILWLVGIAFTMWVLPNKIWAKIISFFGATLIPIMNKGVGLLKGGATLANTAGLEKVGAALDAGSESLDELEDLPRLLVEYTKDGELDAEELKSLIDEGVEAGVSVKELVAKIIALIKKKE